MAARSQGKGLGPTRERLIAAMATAELSSRSVRTWKRTSNLAAGTLNIPPFGTRRAVRALSRRTRAQRRFESGTDVTAGDTGGDPPGRDSPRRNACQLGRVPTGWPRRRRRPRYRWRGGPSEVRAALATSDIATVRMPCPGDGVRPPRPFPSSMRLKRTRRPPRPSGGRIQHQKGSLYRPAWSAGRSRKTRDAIRHRRDLVTCGFSPS